MKLWKNKVFPFWKNIFTLTENTNWDRIYGTFDKNSKNISLKFFKCVIYRNEKEVVKSTWLKEKWL